MAGTYTLINSTTVGSGGAASVTFSSIPATYTDLIVKVSARDSAGVDSPLYLTFNGTSANYSHIYLLGSGSGASGGNNGYGVGSTKFYASTIDGNTNTSNTFGNAEFYIPNYTSSNYKSISIDGVEESNNASAYTALIAGLWSDTSAITSMTLTTGVSFVQYSSFYLYGIKNS